LIHFAKMRRPPAVRLSARRFPRLIGQRGSRWAPLVAGTLAVGSACLGEIRVESGDMSAVPLLLFCLAIALFLLGGRGLARSRAALIEMPEAGATPVRGHLRFWVLVLAGAALAVGVNLFSLPMIDHDLRYPEQPPGLGTWVWLCSLLVFSATGVTVRRLDGWSPLWNARTWPVSPPVRRVLWLVLALLAVLAVVARLVHLDQVPFGINPDEGDRAATSIRIVRGYDTRSIFDTGWYYIPMIYFWLMALVLKVMGIGFAQARVLSALCSIVTICCLTWIGIRHFGARVGLMAGALGAVLGVNLQFARETAEATPSAMLWTISMAFFLEAARSGRSWAWIGAGLTGSCSTYFYPSARLWLVLAALFYLYLLVRGQGGRWRILLGGGLTTIAVLLMLSPFYLSSRVHPEILTERAQQTSIFVTNNPLRLYYYNPKWSTAQLLVAQFQHCIGLFDRYVDGNGFWPTGQPLFSGFLAALFLLGLGWISLRWWDIPSVAVALWFWVGIAGMVVTVETPDLERMATAVPTLALFPALVLDHLYRHVIHTFSGRDLRTAVKTRLLATALLALTVGTLMWQEGHYYFVDYGVMDAWPGPRTETAVVRDQGTETLVVTLGRSFHMVNSGWIRLIAPFTPRGGLESPGSNLPLAVPAAHNLTFMLYPDQGAYLPYLQALYPGGVVRHYADQAVGPVATTYHVTRAQWKVRQGSLAIPYGGQPRHVFTLGTTPSDRVDIVGPMRWVAKLRIPQYWNYSFRIGPGPASLTIDGVRVLLLGAGVTSGSSTVSLARGDHAIAYDGLLLSRAKPALPEWRQEASPGQLVQPWVSIPSEQLTASGDSDVGLAAIARIGSAVVQQRLDSAIATVSFRDTLGNGSDPLDLTWSGTLLAPKSGIYSMSAFTQGLFDLYLDGHQILHNGSTGTADVTTRIPLSRGSHGIRIHYLIIGPGSGLEWKWKPPGSVESIVPPTVLRPPTGAGIGPPIPFVRLGPLYQQPVDAGLYTVQ